MFLLVPYLARRVVLPTQKQRNVLIRTISQRLPHILGYLILKSDWLRYRLILFVYVCIHVHEHHMALSCCFHICSSVWLGLRKQVTRGPFDISGGGGGVCLRKIWKYQTKIRLFYPKNNVCRPNHLRKCIISMFIISKHTFPHMPPARNKYIFF